MPTLIVAGLMALLWLSIAMIVVVQIITYWGAPDAWAGVSFIMFEFSFVLLFLAIFGCAMTIATYGITQAVRYSRSERAAAR